MSNLSSSKETLARLRQMTDLLDNAVKIPGTNYGIGLDPLLGLIPGGGDMLSAVLSAYIILQASQLGAPHPTLLRMAFNIIVDALLGTIPVIGDIFDVTWKANVMNLELLEKHLRSPHQRQTTDQLFVILLLAGLLLIVFAISALSIFIVAQLFKLLTGG